MFVGFDYGTASCAMAQMVDGKPQLIQLEGENCFIPSTLCAPTREAVSEYLFKHWNIPPISQIGEQLLHQAVAFNRKEDIRVDSQSLQFGQAALDLYVEDPEEVYYVKSPKSFLGVTGLQDVQIALFENLVCAMMSNIKRQAEKVLQLEISQTVIGRPVNFQGNKGDDANHQALSILESAARRAGFKEIEFQLEPVAAGLNFEQTLTLDKTVLVVDIGGGTTDCSIIKMGPSWLNATDRHQGTLAHTGCRVGGNDLDIHLAHRKLMPLFGSETKTLKGIDMPISQFWNPVAINNVAAQSDFYAKANRSDLEQLYRNAQKPEIFARLIKLYTEKLSYRVVRDAEKTKIALSEHNQHSVNLDYINESLEINAHELAQAIAIPQQKINELVDEAIKQAQVKPDVIYITGGSARSPILRNALQQQLPNIEIIGGDYFGSVTSGLTYWAERCFR
ncbi:molecular chaperone [Aliivibrio kagoshimensis]|uniref:molecular chaperone n=1 Tax=Aliivibrio kagoshimensis TaxID=2910230 RepID=UPI003D15240C